MENNKKQKRFYKKDEQIWIIELKTDGKVKSINKEDLTMTVTYNENGEAKDYTGKMWSFDKLKYAKKEQLISAKKVKGKMANGKTTYFASVKGGVIPTKNEENAGRDAYARIEPKKLESGQEVFELFLPKMQLTKIPLGFASFLDKKDLLSINWERSSTGALGILNMSGLIDSTYQGEVILQVIPLTHSILITSLVTDIMVNEPENLVLYPHSKAVAQAVVLEMSQAEDVHISYDELLNKPSTRGTTGWGASGK